MKKDRSVKQRLFSAILVLVMLFTSLLGTTFAWFTDSVSSAGNQIVSGTLKVDLSVKDENDQWVSLKQNPEQPIFDYKHWEPGYTRVEQLKVDNLGTLALKYQLSIEVALGTADIGENNAKLSDVIDVYVADGEKTAGSFADITEANGWTHKGTLTEVMEKPSDFVKGQLNADGKENDNAIVTIALHMQESAGNEYQNLSAGDIFVNLIATQATVESDSFGTDYDDKAEFPEIDIDDLAIEVEVEGGLVKATKSASRAGISITVPTGVMVDGVTNGTATLVLSVDEKAESEANVTLDDDEILQPLDVHVEGVSAQNQKAIVITIEKAMPTGLNMGNYELYHVENGATNVMTSVDAAGVDAHNEFYYDPATGDTTLGLATFSEVAAVVETTKAWEGAYDYTWYTNAVAPVDGEAVTEYLIANADQLAAFGAIVGGMAKDENGNFLITYTDSDGDEHHNDSFSDKTVKLIADINLGDDEANNVEGKIFYPVGYWNSEGTYEKTGTAISSGFYAFEGTFDGNGHTVSNFYQNTWEMKGDHDWYAATLQYYRDGMGLFGKVYGGTVKNLTVDNFSSDGEIATTGVIAAYADGATFENIAIFNCNPRVYNIGNGGIVGCVGWYAKEANLKTTFTNITVDNSNKISALWGSYDVACGGIVGQYYPTSGQSSAEYPVNAGIEFTNCHVSAVMDVYNDVCANYQYYAYRYTGMLIGSVRENETINGHVYPKMNGITASGCTVHFGTWNDYYYCEIVDNTTASYTHDYQMSRLTEIKAIDGTTITYLDGKTGTVPASGRANYVIVDYTKGHGTENATCYHFKDGAVWTHDMGGIQTGIDENGDGQDDLKEDKQHIYLEFNNLVTGYGWGVTSRGFSNLDGVKNLDIEQGDHEESVNKFNPLIQHGSEFATESTVTIGDLFAAIENAGVAIKSENVQVTVSPFGATSTAGGTYTANTTDWRQGTLTFSGVGQAVISITDYYFCKTTTITVNIVAADKFDTNFVNYEDYLYRVGNADKSTVTLGTIFKAKDGVTIDSSTVNVAFETIAGNANGTFTANTSDWTKGTIQFNGTGVVKVTISEAEAIDFVLYLEVVDAKNITSATGSKDTDVVLLQDVKISSNGTANYTNCTVYGNGFTFDVCGGMNQYNSKQGHGIIIINNATLDHLRIVGEVYDEYGMYTSDLTGAVQNDYTAAVDATNSTIQNSYIANCAAPIRANGITLVDTALYGGTVANLLISGGTNTLTNVTTINYNDNRGVIGMGIVITDGASDSTKLILNGYLKQYNYIYETDVSAIKVEEAKTVFNSMFGNSFSSYHIGSDPKAVNTGIISINEKIKLKAVLTDNANTGYTVTNSVSVSFSAQGFNKTVDASVASVPSSGSVNNNYMDKGNQQGDYLPTFDFDLDDQTLAKDNDDDTRYLIGDKNGLTAMYPEGESAITLDLTKLASVSKYTGTSYHVTVKCIGPDGTEQTGTVTLNTKGTYTLVFTVEDNLFYDQNGNKINKSVTRTYEVPLVLDIYEKAVADATMTISDSALTGEYITSGTNKKYKMYPLKAITSIMDDANKDGTLETFNFKSNIASAVLSPEGNNAFSSPTTITITYTGGQVLTIVLGTPSDLNSPGASNGGKTFSVKTDSTNGIYLQSDGAVASSSAATGTWPITSWSFKGTSGKVITDSTKVTINFTKPSGGCFAEGTLITLADGTQKPIEQITYEDELLAWDFNTGAYVATVPSLIDRYELSQQNVINLKFSDGTVVRMVVDHGFFDVAANKFVFLNEKNVSSYVGHTFVKVGENGTYENVELVGYEITVEDVAYYSIQTAFYNNCIAEGLFTLTAPPEMLGYSGWFDYFEIGEDMKYDEEKMQADIEKYGLYTYEDFAEYVTYEQFIAFNGPYLKVLVGRGVVTYEQIIELISIYVNP